MAKIVNFSRAFSDEQTKQLREAGVTGDFINIRVQIDFSKPLVEQVIFLVDEVGMSIGEWQNETIWVRLPALDMVTAVMLDELQGRMGYFPSILTWGTVPPFFPIQKGLYNNDG